MTALTTQSTRVSIAEASHPLLLLNYMTMRICVECYTQIRNQMQTRMDAEIVVYSKLRSKASISEIWSTGRQAKESEFQSYRQGLWIRIDSDQNQETKECLVQYHFKLAYKNRHRIKINALMVWQMDRLEYLYTGILNILNHGMWGGTKQLLLHLIKYRMTNSLLKWGW